MKNWKTTLSGIAQFIAPLLHVFFPATFTAEIVVMVNGVLGGLGLMSAKDNNVTGGTIQQ